MKILNRLISAVLIAGMIISSFSAAVLAQEDKTARIFEILEHLEMTPEDFVYAPDAVLTRAQYTQALVALAYRREVVESFEVVSYFHDVEVTAKEAPMIAEAYRRGVVSGNEEKLFYPDREITGDEALVMVMRALGYGYLCEESGGFPDGYRKYAGETGILKNVSWNAKGVVKQEQMLALFYNALEVKLVEAAYGGNASAQAGAYQISDSTLLSVRMIYKEKGIVTANSRLNLYGGTITDALDVMIGPEIYQVSDSGVGELLGFYVEFYYRYDKGDGSRQIIYIEQEKDKNKILQIDAKDLQSASSSQYKYYTEDGRLRSADISSRADIFYNGQPLYELEEKLLAPERGSVKLIDNNGDGKYEVVFIEAREIIVVKNIMNDVIMDLYDSGKNIDLSEEDKTEYVIKSTGGQELELNDIKEWSVLLVNKYVNSVTGKMEYDIVVNYLVESGVIADVKTVGADRQKVISIDVDSRGFYAKQYPVSDIMPESETLQLKKDLTIEFCVDPDGEIVAVRNLSTTDRYAYLFNAYVDEDSQRLMLRMYTDRGTFENLPCREGNLIVDARTYKNYAVEEMETLINNSMILAENPEDNSGHMVRLRINGKGEVLEIDTITQSQEEMVKEGVYDGMRKVKSQYSQRYKSKAMTFGGVFNIAEDTVVFLIPEDDSERQHFQIFTASYFRNDTSYKATAYYSSHDKLRASVAVIYGSSGASLGSDEPAILTDVAQGVGKDDDKGYVLSLRRKSGEVQYFAGEDTNFTQKDIEIGDVVRFSLNINSEIGYIEKTFDKSENKLYKDSAPVNYKYLGASDNYSYTDSVLFVASDVKQRKDDVVIMDINPSYASLTNISFILNNATIFKMDEVRNKPAVVEGNLMDVVSEDGYPGQGSHLFVYMAYGEVRWAYVVNDKS